LLRNGLLLLVAIATACPCAGASFDCTLAKSDGERAVCNDLLLSKLDEDLAVAYRHALKLGIGVKQLNASQRAWLEVRDVCAASNSLGNCRSLDLMYRQRLRNVLASILAARSKATEDEKSARSQFFARIEGVWVTSYFRQGNVVWWEGHGGNAPDKKSYYLFGPRELQIEADAPSELPRKRARLAYGRFQKTSDDEAIIEFIRASGSTSELGPVISTKRLRRSADGRSLTLLDDSDSAKPPVEQLFNLADRKFAEDLLESVYRSPDEAFEFKVPRLFIQCHRSTGRNLGHSWEAWEPDECTDQAPLCGDEQDSLHTEVCFSIPRKELDDPLGYSGATMYVAEVTDHAEAVHCLAGKPNWVSIDAKPVSPGISQSAQFTSGDNWPGGGVDHSIIRAIHGEKCYEIGRSLGFAAGGYEYSISTNFYSLDKPWIEGQLDKAISSLRFLK